MEFLTEINDRKPHIINDVIILNVAKEFLNGWNNMQETT